MAEITGKSSSRMAEHENLNRARNDQTTARRGRLSLLMSIGMNLINLFRSRRTKATNFPETSETHEQDERSNQLWATYSKGQVEKPRSPMDILR